MAEQRVIVVGGGLAGLAAATALGNAGIETKVFERARELLPAGAVISVMANTARALDRAGLGQLVEEVCVPVVRLEYLDWNGRYLAHMPISEVAEKMGTQSYIALRSDMQLGMYRRLGDGIVQLQSTCVGFDQDDAGVTAKFDDGREERGAVLLGADGIRSAVRAHLCGDSPRYAGYSGWRGITRMDSPPLSPGLGKQVGGRGKTWGAFGLSDNRIYWFSSAAMEEGRGDTPAGRKEDVRRTFEGAPDWVRDVIEATPEENMIRADIYDRPPVDRWGEGRVTLLGDSAHATTPNTGQGGSHALLDGILVAERLAAISDSLDDPAAVRDALQAYERERIPETSKVVKEAGFVGKFVHWQNPMACAFRNLAFYRLTPQAVWRRRAGTYLKAGV